MNDFGINEMLEMQKALQEKYKDKWEGISPEIGKNISKRSFGDHFDDSAITRSKEFPACYKAVADRNGCIFLDAAKAARPSEEDGLHLMPEEHKSLAEAVCACIREELFI